MHFLTRGSFKRGFCVRPDLASSVVSASLFLSIFPPFPSLPLYLQPPPVPVPPHPTRESGVCLRPKHTGKDLKKARLRCAFAISSTFLSPHFFSTSFQLISYDLYHDLTSQPFLANPVWTPRIAISLNRHLPASWAPLPPYISFNVRCPFPSLNTPNRLRIQSSSKTFTLAT